MFLVSRRIVWTQQPHELRGIDRLNPVTEGLVSAVLPNIKQYVGEQKTDGAFTSTNIVTTPYGRAIGRNGSTWSLTQRSIAPISTSSDVTILAFMFGGSTVATESQPVSTGQNAGALSSAITIGDGTAKTLRFRNYLGATKYTGGSFIVPDGPVVVVGRQKYNVEQALFVGGEKDPITTAFTGANPGYGFFGGYSGNASTKVLLQAIWRRALSDEEIRSLSDNPWQIFASRETRIFVPLAAGGATGYTLDAQPASVAVTGASATLKSSRTLSADAGSVAIAGANADLVYTPVGASPVLNADPGSLTIVGAPAALKATRKLAADAGSITISGAAATLVKSTAGLTLNAQPGSVTIAGAAAEYRRTYKLEASSAGITIVGASAQLVYAGATGPTTRAPDGAGPSIIQAGTIRPSNTGGRRH